jgi:hypothetical protein
MTWFYIVGAYLVISSAMIAYCMGRASREYDAWLQQVRREVHSMTYDFERPE